MATAYIVWDRRAKAPAKEGVFLSSADATQHANTLAAHDARTEKTKPGTTYDIVTVNI